MPGQLIYRGVAALLGGAAEVFFRRIHVVGQEHLPPVSTPVVFAGNHPNSLIDPVLVITTSGRVVHFAAKDKLFAPPLGPVLRALGAVPIARRMDHGDRPGRDNRGALDALCEVLVEGRCVGIFPEGLSHDRAQLQRLRSGAARVALQAAASGAVGLCMIPVGLHYVHRKRFRARVLVQFGEPIEVTEGWVQRWREEPRRAARELTDAVGEGLRALVVEGPDWDTLRVLDGVRRLYQPPDIRLDQRVELARRFARHFEEVREEPEVQAVYQRVSHYLDALDDAGLSDAEVRRGLQGAPLFRRGMASLARLLFWLPLALPGAPLHLPLGLLVGWAGLRFAPRKDVIGTSRLLLGLLAVLSAYMALPLLLGMAWGWPWALLAAPLLPLSGYATLRVLERGASLSRLWQSARAALRMRARLRELRVQRQVLEQQVLQAVDRYRPEDLELLFPRSLE